MKLREKSEFRNREERIQNEFDHFNNDYGHQGMTFKTEKEALQYHRLNKGSFIYPLFDYRYVESTLTLRIKSLCDYIDNNLNDKVKNSLAISINELIDFDIKKYDNFNKSIISLTTKLNKKYEGNDDPLEIFLIGLKRLMRDRYPLETHKIPQFNEKFICHDKYSIGWLVTTTSGR